MRKRSLVSLLIVVALLAVAVVMPSCARAPTPTGPIKIGYVGPDTHDYGKTQIAGAELAIKELNEAGGVLGRQLELVVADSELKSAGASTAVHRLVEVDKVDFLAGCYGSEETMGAREAAADLKTLAIFSGGATHDWITTTLEDYERYKYIFRNSPLDELDAEARYVIDEQVPWLEEQLKKQLGIGEAKVAVLTDAAKWQDLCHDLYLKDFPAKGYDIVYESRYDTKATDASVELSAIKKSGAHIIVAGMAYSSTLPLVRQWGEMEVPALWAGVNVLAMAPGFREQTGGKCVYASTYNMGAAHVAITPETKKVWDHIVKEVGRCYFSSHGPYVSIYSFKHAADLAGTLETEAMVKAVEKIKFDSVGGTIDYDDANHSHIWGPLGKGSLLWTLQHQPGGKFVMIHPEEYADGELMLPPWMK
mgnify:CR=1 FL=1